MAAKTIPIRSTRVRRRRHFEYISTKKDELVGWARKFSLVSVPVRHRVLRDGVHGGELDVRMTPTASAPRCRASHHASPIC